MEQEMDQKSVDFFLGRFESISFTYGVWGFTKSSEKRHYFTHCTFRQNALLILACHVYASKEEGISWNEVVKTNEQGLCQSIRAILQNI
eukprot:2580106-Amphidinium_carterae.1